MDSKTETLDSLYELFYIATYGCNRRLESVVENALQEQCLPNNFVFHEYFFHQPLCRNMDISENGYILAPFAIRMIERSLLIPKAKEEKGLWTISYIPRDDKYCIDTKIRVLNGSSWLTRAAFIRWKKKEYEATSDSLLNLQLEDSDRQNKFAFNREKELGLTYNFKSSNARNPHDKWFGMFSKFTPAIFKQVADDPYKDNNGKPHDITNCSRNLQYGFMKLLYPEESKNTQFFSLFVPIASSHLFYGAVWFKFPVVYDKPSEDMKDTFKNIGFTIAGDINDIYVPTLALLHNHFCERISTKDELAVFLLPLEGKTVAAAPDKTSQCSYKNVFLEKKMDENTNAIFSEPIEKGLVGLWKNRQAIKGNGELKDDDDTFIFRKYLVCSKLMVDLTRKVIEDAEGIKVNGKILPSALVIGSAGSGKDTFAKMSGIFSKSFCAGKRHTLNMASLKPAPLVSGMVMGVDIEIGMPAIAGIPTIGGAYTTYNIKGILQKIRQQTIESVKPGYSDFYMDEFVTPLTIENLCNVITMIATALH